MFRNPRGLWGGEGSAVVEGSCFPVPPPQFQPPPPPPQLFFILFYVFFVKQKNISNKAFVIRAQKGAWTFVKRFDCTAHAEHNQQVIYRAHKRGTVYCLGTTQTQYNAIWQKSTTEKRKEIIVFNFF